MNSCDKIAIDRVVPRFDLQLLNLVFLLFLCFVLLDWAVRHLRNILTLHYSSLLNSLAFGQSLHAPDPPAIEFFRK